MKESELSNRLLYKLFEKDKNEGSKIYNIDELGKEFGINDLNRINRIVVDWDDKGFVNEYCDKRSNCAELTLSGIKNIEGFESSTTGSDLKKHNSSNNNSDKVYKYDVALSFAGEERDYVQEVAKYLKKNKIKYFFDEDKKAENWGKDLIVEFDRIFSKESKYCLMFISESYEKKMWTTHERKSALIRNLKTKGEYILPIKFDEVEIDGLHTSIGYLNANIESPEDIVNIFLFKIGRDSSISHDKKEFSKIPDIIKFEIIPNKVKKGERAVYYWEVNNVDQNIVIENHHSLGGSGEHYFGKNYKGYYTVDNVQDSVTYILEVENNLGKVSSTIELEVEESEQLLSDHETKVLKNLQLFQTIGSKGTGNGQFQFRRGGDSNGGLFIKDGFLYVTDWENERLQIFEENHEGRWIYEKSLEGSKSFNSPIIVNNNKDLFITTNNKIYKYIYGEKPPGVIHVDIQNFCRICLDKYENIFVQTRSDINKIIKYNIDGVFIVKFGGFGSYDGKFDNKGWTADLVSDGSGNIYILDVGNKRVQKFDNEGEFLNKWDVDITGYSYMAIDELNRIYVSENNYRELIVYDTEGNLINKFNIPAETISAGSYIFIYKNQFFASNSQNHTIKVFKLNLE